MKLWLLRPIRPEIEEDKRYWWDDYNIYIGFVIRAETEERARQLADEKADCVCDEQVGIWLDSSLTSCVELIASGPEEVIIHDYTGA